MVTSNGVKLDEVIINGPPTPPLGFTRMTAQLPEPKEQSGVNTLQVPAFSWSFGCSATTAAMIAGYYDRTGYPNMYTGPTNGGVMPMDNSSWPDWVDGSGATRHQCPLSATHQGLDGRTTKGHVDDYWVAYGSTAPDPFYGNWTEHTYGDCTGDYMKTNQTSNYGNSDGGTTFYYWTDSGAPLTAEDMEAYGIQDVDGGYGFKLFLESRGYTVTTMFNQRIHPNYADGFTFEQYKAQIDAGSPVFIQVEGHTMAGIGYDDATQTVYLNDTWDHSTHTMTWGGSYSGMAHYAVTVVNLAEQTSPVDIYFLIDTSGSYFDDLPNFKAEAPGMISSLQASFPDTQFGLGTFEDYPISPFGDASSEDVAYRQDVDLTPDPASILALIDGDYSNGELETKNGVDWPQSQLTALYQAATGAGQDLTAEGYSGASIAPGQQANFRDGAVKLFLLFTDAPYHNPGDPGDIPYPGETFNDTVDAILALDPSQVLSVVADCSGGCPSGTFEDAVADAEDMAVATNSIAPAGGVDCNNDGVIDIPEGEPLVCTTSYDSTGIGNTVIKMIEGAIEAVTPVAQCKDMTVFTDSDSCVATSVSIDDGSFDPDEGPITLSQFPSEPYSVGDTLVTLTVTDETGLSDSCTATVTVEDDIAPVVVTQDITVQLDENGNASITPEDIDDGSTDNCGIASMTVAPSEFTCADLGEKTVTLTVTDNNGNVAEETATVTVLPYTIPVSTTGVITDKPESSYRDVAVFKMTGVTDIGTVAKDAAAAGTALTFDFRTADEGPLYSFTADSFDAAGNRMIYSDTEGNMLRCIFSTERCVVRMRSVDFDGDALDASLPRDMTVNLQVGCTKYSNTGHWQQYDSGSGTWTKYRKDN